MSEYRIQKGSLKGEIVIPSSKSHTLRAVLFAALAQGKSVIHNYLSSTDTQSMIHACRLMGASIDIFDNRLEINGINGRVSAFEDVIDAGNSGIVYRFFTAIGALTDHPVVLTGDHSIRHSRPIKPLLDAMSQLGVSSQSMRGDGYAPVIIQGPLQPGKTRIFGADSQPVSALLIAAAFAEGPIEIEVENAGEKPWIALTLDWLTRLGIPFEHRDFDYFRLLGNAKVEGFEYTVPGDFSSAAFPIAAALVTQSELTIKNVDMADVQGDKELIAVFQKMGAIIEVDEMNKVLQVKRGPPLSGMTVDINNFVDAITILSVVACYAEGETLIQNGAIAKEKECNRIVCITSELRKMGAEIHETADGLLIKKSPLKGANVHSYNDHRMAMSLAVAGLWAEGETGISSVECISKTFPSFASDFKNIGANLQELL